MVRNGLMNPQGRPSCLCNNAKDVSGGGIELGAMHDPEFVALKRCKGALYEGKAGYLHPGRGLGVVVREEF
jgi:hypothetical protein